MCQMYISHSIYFYTVISVSTWKQDHVGGFLLADIWHEGKCHGKSIFMKRFEGRPPYIFMGLHMNFHRKQVINEVLGRIIKGDEAMGIISSALFRGKSHISRISVKIWAEHRPCQDEREGELGRWTVD